MNETDRTFFSTGQLKEKNSCPLRARNRQFGSDILHVSSVFLWALNGNMKTF